MTVRAWLLFAASSLIWGVPYLFIKIAVDDGVSPTFLAWARVALAAVLLVPFALRRGALHGLVRRGPAILAYTATEIAIPFVLIPIGERYITSALTAILIATMPLLVAAISLRVSPADRPGAARVLGLVIGLAGVVALLGIDVAGKREELWGALIVLLATLCYAVAPLIVSRRLVDLDPIGPVAASLTLAAIVLLPFALTSAPRTMPPPGALGAIVVLGALCTAAGLVVFFSLIAAAGPTRASVITYVNPLVAVVAGVLALGEQVGVMSVAGLALILGGSWLSTGGRDPHSG
ncbi:MAG TPA: DMT family transporter [Gemmatimonadales bacterium]|nr:DMT family transporter [Gemmatimonadales bacterium]